MALIDECAVERQMCGSTILIQCVSRKLLHLTKEQARHCTSRSFSEAPPLFCHVDQPPDPDRRMPPALSPLNIRQTGGPFAPAGTPRIPAQSADRSRASRHVYCA